MNHEIEFGMNNSFECDSDPHWRFTYDQESGGIAIFQLWISLYYTRIVDYSYYKRNQWKVITTAPTKVEKLNQKTKTNSLGYRSILVLNLVFGVFRTYFAYLGTTEAIKEFLTVTVSPTTMTIINAMFLLLGVGGLIASIGMILKKSWSINALVLVSLANIIFDIWGYTIQFTAVLGVVVPVITLLVIYRSVKP